MSVYPAISLDMLYQITKNWNSYISVSKNWHPMAAMSEGGSAECKMVKLYYIILYYITLYYTYFE